MKHRGGGTPLQQGQEEQLGAHARLLVGRVGKREGTS
jgi:hypothetical protein